MVVGAPVACVAKCFLHFLQRIAFMASVASSRISRSRSIRSILAWANCLLDLDPTSFESGITNLWVQLLTDDQGQDVLDLSCSSARQSHFGGNGMQQYSACFIGPDGHVTQRRDLLCADDAEAHQQATEL